MSEGDGAEAVEPPVGRPPGRPLDRRGALRLVAATGLSMAAGAWLGRDLLHRAGLHRVEETRSRLGTLVSLTAVHPEAAGARAVVAAGFEEIERLEGLLSRHALDTPMARLNANGALADPPADLLTVLDAARRWHRRTRGAFDPTVAPLLELWAGRDGASSPSAAALRRARALVGFDAVSWSAERVSLGRPGARLTLDGIAKGFVVDRTVAALVGAGAERVLVDAGGDLASGGPGSATEPWPVLVQDPRRPAAALGEVRLAGRAVASSGDYMQAFTRDLRHHHVLDPRTGRSPVHTAGVTVTAPSAMDADALSTALMVMGGEEGVALAESIPGVEALVVGKRGDRRHSSGFGRS